MSDQPCQVLVCALGFSLLLAGCSRHGVPKRADAHRSPVNSPPVKPTKSSDWTSDPSLPAQTSAVLAGRRAVAPVERPSPFASRSDADAPSPPTRSANPSHFVSRAHAATKPFKVPVATAANKKVRPITPPLPPAPAIRQSALNAIGLLPFRDTTCCTATATYEPAKPSGIQRVIHKLPGLRRLDPAAGGKGFVPPRPMHEIQFALPPGASPVLMQTKRMDLKASVDASGHVTRVELLAPLDEDLVKLAAYAANGWRFTPAEMNEQPVPSKILLHFSFDTNSSIRTALDKSARQ